MKKTFSVVLFLLAVAIFAHADYYIKSRYHADPISRPTLNRPAKEEIHEQWIGTDKFASITPDMTLVLDLAQSKAWVIDHENRNYFEANLPLSLAKVFPPSWARSLATQKSSVSVQATGQQKIIGQWSCSGYIATITGVTPRKITVWATEDVPFDLDIYSTKIFFNRISNVILAKDEASKTEFRKIKGFWISEEEDTVGITSASSEVIEISQKEPSPGIYLIPAGYTQVKFLTLK